MSTLAVDTWRAVKIWTKNLTEVQNRFLPLTQVPHMIQKKTHVLNLKTLKTQVPMRYLTLVKCGVVFFIASKLLMQFFGPVTWHHQERPLRPCLSLQNKKGLPGVGPRGLLRRSSQSSAYLEKREREREREREKISQR
jgi:hypothetical protein